MNKKIIFLVLSLLVSSCSSGNENTIDELEEQIEALENKQNLTPEEETELENLKTEAEEIPPPPPEVLEFENEREAINLANDTSYGLSATIWSEDNLKLERVSEKIYAGVIWTNCWLVRDLRTPFGGMKKSGYGREGGREAIHFFTEQKTICRAI